MPDGSDSRSTPKPTDADPVSWLTLDIVDDDGDWSAFQDIEDLAHRAGQAVANHKPFRRERTATVCIALSSDLNVQKLNTTFRGKDKPTNVLSFPAPPMPMDMPFPRQLGDVVLAIETILSEAHEQDIKPTHHLQHLVVHGLLHLLGFDHETDSDAEAMEALETEILATIGIPNPHAAFVMTASPSTHESQ
jgi:probable rRNA maturation factor